MDLSQTYIYMTTLNISDLHKIWFKLINNFWNESHNSAQNRFATANSKTYLKSTTSIKYYSTFIADDNTVCYCFSYLRERFYKAIQVASMILRYPKWLCLMVVWHIFFFIGSVSPLDRSWYTGCTWLLDIFKPLHLVFVWFIMEVQMISFNLSICVLYHSHV